MPLPYDYYPAVLYAIDLIGQGHTKTAACDLSNIPVATFNSYVGRNEELRVAFEEAEDRGSDAMADALINIDNHKVHGQSDPKMAKVISDNIKWLLSKRRVREYGDRVVVDHSVSVDVAITTALDAARTRVASAKSGVVIDAEVVYDDEDAKIMQELLR